MTVVNDTPITELVNDLLDRIRTERALTSDEALARLLGVSGQAIYRWRKGQIDPIGRALLPYALGQSPGGVHDRAA